MTIRLGFVHDPSQRPETLPNIARAAEDSGLDDLWVWEDCFKQSGIAAAATALAGTQRIHVGIGLMPAPLRNVALATMEVATLARIFPGRFTAGLGHGVQDWMGQAGARVASPLTLLREYTTAMRSLLAGERVTTTGRYVTLNDVALDWPPDVAPPLMLGGIGPRTLALAGELGDGVLLASGKTPDDVRSTLRIALDARGGESGKGIPGAGSTDVAASGAGPAAIPGAAFPVVAVALCAAGPIGAERVGRVLAKSGDSPASAVTGSAEQIADAVRGFAAAGATTLALVPTPDEPDAVGLVEFLGQEVAPLL